MLKGITHSVGQTYCWRFTRKLLAPCSQCKRARVCQQNNQRIELNHRVQTELESTLPNPNLSWPCMQASVRQENLPSALYTLSLSWLSLVDLTDPTVIRNLEYAASPHCITWHFHFITKSIETTSSPLFATFKIPMQLRYHAWPGRAGNYEAGNTCKASKIQRMLVYTGSLTQKRQRSTVTKRHDFNHHTHHPRWPQNEC